jgi:hypothetical protein
MLKEEEEGVVLPEVVLEGEWDGAAVQVLVWE